MRAGALLAAAATVALVAGCTEHGYDPPSEEQKVADAEALYSPALFDTVTWSADSLRLAQGNLVYADECRLCHGPLGRGETPYNESRELAVPSLVEPEWRYEDDPEAIRRRIFVGHQSGMPNWGIGQLTPRQIDAAAFYILEQLRPEVLGGDSDGG